jgi:hypothetical protein
MAQLGSPGVQVTVIDESFYNPATPGTIPLLVVATAQDKTNASGSGIAIGTAVENANELYLATSQKDLTDRYGTPTFEKDSSGNAMQGSELNEYGLFAAYSFLGASSSAYILRANVDLGAITGRAIAPTGRPESGTYWVDTSRTRFGIFEWNASTQRFVTKTPLLITTSAQIVTGTGAPNSSIGSIGDYAVVMATPSNITWFKNTAGNWVKAGSADWADSWATAVLTVPLIDFTVNGQEIVVGGQTSIEQQINAIVLPGTMTNAGLTATVSGGTLTIRSTGVSVAVTIGMITTTYRAPAVQFSNHTRIPSWFSNDTNTSRPTGSIWIKTTEFNLGAKWAVKRYNSDTRLFELKDTPVFVGGEAALLSLDPLGGGTNIPANTVFVDADFERDSVVQFKLKIRTTGFTVGSATVGSTTGTVRIAVSVPGSADMTVSADIVNPSNIEALVAAINNSAAGQVAASVGVSLATFISDTITFTHPTGGEIHLIGDAWNTMLTSRTNIEAAPTGSGAKFRISNWQDLSSLDSGYVVQDFEPNNVPEDNTLWYASYQTQVDIMVHNGTEWVGYREYDHGDGLGATNSAGPFVQASRPTGTIRKGDLWIDTSDQDNYGKNIKRWSGDVWDAIDVTDHTSQFGIIFADARWGNSGATGNTAATISQLLSSSYLDPDAPDPAAYPRGMLLWNTRRSGFNIKQYKQNYINVSSLNPRQGDESMSGYEADRWVSVSGQDVNQVAYFGRRAQRAYVVGQLKVAINTNQRILDEDNIFFNLIACPGYPEVISDMVNLNNARNGTALIIGDTPMRLESNAQALINYGTDFANTGTDGEEGLQTNSDHLAVYYPSGLTTDLSGSNVVVPPSHMMLRTIAISDQRSFQWFAPAGTRRGGITNASSVGFLRGGSFIPVSLNQGTRDQMAQVKINPITNIPGAGLVAFGQQTKTGVNSSLDRINVARLVSYLRRQLGIITKPFLFEPNDKQTRSEIKNVCESLMLDLVSLRGIYDFVVVCDETNNTPSIIANNQLYVDIAVEPVKAVEFIYIPLRLKNVGDIRTRQ